MRNQTSKEAGIKPKKARKPTIWSKTSFWGRFLTLCFTTFIFFVSIRFSTFWTPLNVLAVLLLLIVIPVEVVWLGISAFKKTAPGTRWHKPRKRVTRVLMFILVMPLATLVALGVGSGVSYAIAPMTKQELAVQAAYRAEEAKRVAAREKAEAEKRKAEEALKASQAAAEEAKQQEAERVAAEVAAKKALDEEIERKKNAAVEQSKRQNAEAQKAAEAAAAKAKKIDDLKSSKPLLYATEYCSDLASQIGFSPSSYISVDESGSSLFLTTKNSKDTRGLLMYACVAKALDFSAPLKSNIETTNALAGTRSWKEGKLDFQWSYHPRTGLNLSILKTQSCFLWVCS